jgi:ubiquinone biosynthesis protein
MELYPDFNVFDVAKPYARELLIERFTPQRIARRTGNEVRNMASMLHELPYQVHDTLEQFRDGQIEVRFRHEGLEDLIARMDQVFNRIGIAVVAVGGAITSAVLASVANGVGSFFGILSVIGLALSGLLSIWLVWGVIRSGRL